MVRRGSAVRVRDRAPSSPSRSGPRELGRQRPPKSGLCEDEPLREHALASRHGEGLVARAGADVVEAMASHRPYRAALGVAAALEEVHAGAGTRYEAFAVAACERVFAQGFVFTES